MAQSNTLDPEPDSLQNTLRDQLPFEWGVRVHEHPRDDALRVSMHHTDGAHVNVRTVGDGQFAVRVKSSGTGHPRRVLHPENAPADVTLDLQRCLDRAVVKAYQFSRTGSFFHDAEADE